MSRYKPYSAYKESGIDRVAFTPAHWEIRRLKHLVASLEQGWSPQCDTQPASPDMWGVLKVGCVNGGTFDPRQNKALPLDIEPKPYLALKQGDVLVSRANTRELVGGCAVVDSDQPTLMLCDKLYRLRPNGRASSAYLARIIQVFGRSEVEMEASGTSASMVNISMGTIRNLQVCLPPAPEQERIVEGVDRATARIDALIAKKTRFIELLKEKRQALITHAVTQGLDPTVAMKDSGVEWIGKVPAHWGVAQLSKVSISRCDGPFGSGLKSEHYTESGVRVVRLQNIGWAEFKGEDAAFIAPEYWRDELGGGHDVIPGDVLVAGLGDDKNPLGRACVAPVEIGEAMVKADCYRFRIGSRATPEYVALTLSATSRAECGFLATGATRDRLNLTLASARVIPLPPIEEQREVVRTLGMRASRIDLLVNRTESSLALLKERRSALITAAVTGQIDLRGALDGGK